MTTSTHSKPKNSWFLLYSIMLIIAVVALFLGLLLPMLTLTKFYFFDNSVSVISGIVALWEEHHYALFLIIGLFSVVFPIAKVGLLAKILWDIKPNKTKRSSSGKSTKLLSLMHDYGRWGMLDVFVVAVLIVTVKLKAIASVEIHAGLYFFGAAVLILMILTHFLSKYQYQSEYQYQSDD